MLLCEPKIRNKDSCILYLGIDFSGRGGVNFGLSFLGPVVQSIVSLTSSLRGQLVKCFATL